MEEVKQFNLFFSNRLEVLAEKLFTQLYKNRDPFQERWVIVPSRGVKFWLERFLAKKAIFFGVEVLPVDSALKRLLSAGNRLPTHIELTLAIREKLGPQRDPLLAEKWALLFRRYGLYGYSSFAKWEREEGLQQRVWRELFGSGGPFIPLAQALSKPAQRGPDCHLFGLSHLPRPIAHFFRELNSYFYQLSFCESFWSDLLSDKELLTLQEKCPSEQSEESLLVLTEERPPLLANFALVMRNGNRVLEEYESIHEENYLSPNPETQLDKVQAATLAFQSSEKWEADHSIQLHQAPSLMREVEILRNRLLYLLQEEKYTLDEIVILAPDSNLYAPYLKALIPFPMTFLDDQKVETGSEIEALFLLIGLEKRRFSSAAIIEFLSHPLVQKKQGFTEEDLAEIRRWIEELHIRWGFDVIHKNQLMKHNRHPLTEEKNTFKEGLERLVAAIAEEGELVKISKLELLYEFHILIHKLYQDSRFLHAEQERSLETYCTALCEMACYYFCKEEEKSELLSLLRQLRQQGGAYQTSRLSFLQVCSFLQAMAEREGKSSQTNEIHTLVVASLSTGSQIPCKISYLLGLSEEQFPRKESPSHFDLLQKEKNEEYLPSKSDFDRGFFLEAFFSCQKRFYMSYMENASLIVQEFVDCLASITKYIHPQHAVDPSYFVSEDPHYRSFCEEEYRLSKAVCQREEKQDVKQFTLQIKGTSECTLTIQELLRFVKSPLKHYFKHKGKLYFNKEEPIKEEEEFTLSSLDRTIMVRQRESLAMQIENRQKRGAFPQGTFGELALRSVRKKEEEQEALFAFHGIQPHELTSFSLQDKPLQLASYQIIGLIENVLPQGLFVYEKGDFSGIISALPALLALNCYREARRLFFGKDEKIWDLHLAEPKDSLQKIIELSLWAREEEMLLFPELIEPILKKDRALLTKRLQQIKLNSYDEALEFAYRHRPLPTAEELLDRFYLQVRECYQEVYDDYMQS